MEDKRTGNAFRVGVVRRIRPPPRGRAPNIIHRAFVIKLLLRADKTKTWRGSSAGHSNIPDSRFQKSGGAIRAGFQQERAAKRNSQ